jgi:Sigma 54 modulation/S30EA ribosomal protein C terminus
LSDDPDELPGELPVGKPGKLPPEVVREKVFALKPMTLETALEQVRFVLSAAVLAL